MRIRRFLHVLLVGISCWLLWQIIETWRRPLEGQPSPGPQRSEEDSPSLAVPTPDAQIGERDVAIIADKDLFSPTRSRAVTEEAPPVVTVPPPSHLKLVGIVLAKSRAEALFADATQGGKVVRLTTGESLGAYKLVTVSPSQATLTGGREGDEVALPLLVGDSQSAAQAQRLLPVVTPPPQDRPPQQAVRTVDAADRSNGTLPPASDAVVPNEANAIRQNILQLQQRLRQIRKQTAANNTGNQADDTTDDEQG